jgi:hypothetical protein
VKPPLSGHPLTGEPPGAERSGRTDLDSLRRRLGEVRAAGPFDHALAAGLLAVDLGNAYRGALLARDAAACSLHTKHGWSYFALARVIFGAGAHAHRVRAAVASVSPDPGVSGDAAEAEAVFRQRQARVEELRRLLTQSRRLAVSHIGGRANDQGGWPDLGLPEDAAQRVRSTAEQLRLTDSYRLNVAAHRNVAAASLVEHADWAVPEVAVLARTAPEHVDAARVAVGSQVVSYADPGTVAELADIVDALAGRAYALREIQDEAMYQLLSRGVSSHQVAALGQVPPSHVERLRPVGVQGSQVPRLHISPRRTPARRVT